SALDLLFDFEKGGLTWIGTYGPTRDWELGAQRGSIIMEKHGFPPLIVARSMKGGHFGVLRFIVAFDKGNSSELDRVRMLTHELAEALLEIGFVPYKAPGWTARIIMERAHPGFVHLLSMIKKMLDPNNVMNPGRWAI
ncbi:MAG: FAD-linked oxidase C-terminal domain-containing protein, partial [Candidatus Bathyarchaeia archaeon]